jgi:hypothetical protein
VRPLPLLLGRDLESAHAGRYSTRPATAHRQPPQQAGPHYYTAPQQPRTATTARRDDGFGPRPGRVTRRMMIADIRARVGRP